MIPPCCTLSTRIEPIDKKIKNVRTCANIFTGREIPIMIHVDGLFRSPLIPQFLFVSLAWIPWLAFLPFPMHPCCCSPTPSFPRRLPVVLFLCHASRPQSCIAALSPSFPNPVTFLSSPFIPSPRTFVHGFLELRFICSLTSSLIAFYTILTSASDSACMSILLLHCRCFL